MAPEQAASGRVDGRATCTARGGRVRSAGRRIGAVQRGSGRAWARVARRSADLSTRLATRARGPAGAAAGPIDRLRPQHGSPRSAAPRSGRGALGGGRCRRGMGAVALRLLLGSQGACRFRRDAPGAPRGDAVRRPGHAAYPASQLPEYFISRFRPVERLSEVRLVSRGWPRRSPASIRRTRRRKPSPAASGRSSSCRGASPMWGPTVTLQRPVYEGGRARRSAKAEGRVGAEESEVMDRVWAALYPEFTPGSDATLPNGRPRSAGRVLERRGGVPPQRGAEPLFGRSPPAATRRGADAHREPGVARIDAGVLVARGRVGLPRRERRLGVQVRGQRFGAAVRESSRPSRV